MDEPANIRSEPANIHPEPANIHSEPTNIRKSSFRTCQYSKKNAKAHTNEQKQLQITLNPHPVRLDKVFAPVLHPSHRLIPYMKQPRQDLGRREMTLPVHLVACRVTNYKNVSFSNFSTGVTGVTK